MKSIFLFGLLAICLSLASCSFLKQSASDLKKSAGDKIASAIVKTGECAQAELVKADVYELLKIESEESLMVKALAGEKAPEGSEAQGVVSEICKAAAKLALPSLLKKGVPSKWECGLTDLTGKIELLASQACDEIPL